MDHRCQNSSVSFTPFLQLDSSKGRGMYSSLPTSYEKMLIYALPSSIVTATRERNSSIVLVLGPLVALMAEQKTHTHLVLGRA